MKQVLLAAFTFLLLQTTQAQIQMDETKPAQTIGEVKAFGVLLSNLSYKSEGEDTTYTLTFRDLQYKTLTEYKTIAFMETGNVLSDLYNVLMQAINKQETNFKLGTHSVSTHPVKQMGTKGIAVLVDTNGYFDLSEKQINKLFNRRA